MMETTTKYHPLISLFLSEDELRPVLMVPALRGGYIWATNGHALIRIDRDVIDGPIANVENYPDVEGVFKTATDSTLLTGTMKASRLSELLGKLPTYPVYEDCSECDGDGKVACPCCSNEMDCDACGATGHTDKLLGSEYNIREKIGVGKQAFSATLLHKISKVLEETKEEEADIYQSKAEPVDRQGAIIKFLKCQVLLMPVFVEYPDEISFTLKID